MPKPNPFRNRRPVGCAHDASLAVVSAVYQGAERTASEPHVVCCGCGAVRLWFSGARWFSNSRWSPSLAEDMASSRYSFPEGASFLVRASSLTPENVDAAGRAAWEWWVDLDYGRRLLFGRLRPEDVGRAEKDAALGAGMSEEMVDRMKAEHRRQDEEARERSGR